MAAQGFDYPDLGGGINAGQAPAQIQNSEFADLQNFYPYGSFLRRRGGYRLVSGHWPGHLATGLFSLKLNTGDWETVVAARDEFAWLNGAGAFVPMVHAAGITIPSGSNPWVMFQYMGFGYALRRGDSRLYRFSRDTIYVGGIAAPVTAPVLADGGAGGALTAANYRGVYTYFNMETGYESNPSPVSNILALGANRMINWSGISVSSNPFVTARRIYRVLPDQINEYFFVAQINNNVDTTFNGDNVVVADLGRTVSFYNGLPPGGLTCGTIWNEMLFAGDGTDLYFSEFLMPEMFSGDFISIYPDDGHEIRGLAGFGDRLIIGKTNKMYYLVGTSRANFAIRTLSDAHGCLSHHSMQTAEGVMYWFGTGKRVYRTDGTSVKDISTPRIAPLLDAIPDAEVANVVGALYPELDWYVLTLPGTVSNDVLVYNYRNDAWTVFSSGSASPTFIGDSYDTNFGHSLYATALDDAGTGSIVLKFNDPTYNVDDLWNVAGGVRMDNPITALLITKSDDFGYPGFRKYYDEVWLLAPGASGALWLTARGENGAMILSRPGLSLSDPPSDWKNYKLGTSRWPSTVLSLAVVYSGALPVDIQQLHFQVGVLGRKVGQPR